MQTPTNIEQLRQELASVKPNAKPPKARKSPIRDAIGKLLPDLLILYNDKGYSYGQIAEILSAKGLKTTGNTVRGYMSRERDRQTVLTDEEIVREWRHRARVGERDFA